MKPAGNTILITGGGSGIGEALAVAFHKLGNHVIISGRRQHALDQVATANPGIKGIPLDIEDPKSIAAFAQTLTRDFPRLNVVIHNAGIMRPEKILDQNPDVPDAEAMIATNLLGPIRLTAALLTLLQKQPHSTIMNVSSGLAFVPMAMTPTYSATKSAIHAYTLALRHQLKDTTTQVIELIPPYVQTHLMGAHQAADPRAMPLQDFIDEVMQILTTQPNVTEVIVEKVKPLRFAAENGAVDHVFALLNAEMH